MIDRLQPQSIEAEQSLLGALLIDNNAINKIISIVDTNNFYKQNHRAIYASILKLFNDNEPIDILTVSGHLQTIDKLEFVGGRAYINDLAFSVISSANIEYYAQMVHEKYIRREIIKLADEVINMGYEVDNKDEILSFASSEIGKLISKSEITNNTFELKEITFDFYNQLEKNYMKKGKLNGLSTGFHEVDKLTGGFGKGQYIILAGRPSMGKTAFALNISVNTSKREDKPVLFFSIEMSKEQLINRIAASETDINSMKIKNATLSGDDWSKVANFMGRGDDYNLIINDKAGISIEEICAKSKEMFMKKTGLSMIVIDYIGLITSKSMQKEIREQEVSRISRSLKNLARELNVPVVCLSQLSRACESRQDKRPMLSDLRESGSLEQDADIVIFMYRDEYYDPANTDNKGKAEAIFAKQRDGMTGFAELVFENRTTTFKNPAGREYSNE